MNETVINSGDLDGCRWTQEIQDYQTKVKDVIGFAALSQMTSEQHQRGLDLHRNGNSGVEIVNSLFDANYLTAVLTNRNKKIE